MQADVAGGEAQRHERDRADERADGEHLAAEARDERAGGHRGGQEAQALEGEDQAAVERIEATALLQLEREHEEERGDRRVEDHDRRQPGGERAVGEQPGVHERAAAARGDAALVDREHAKQQRARGERQPRPRRPAVVAPLDQGHEDRDHSERDEAPL
ncbi:MAG TPA: hypothetical protein VH834_14710 [Solirubrobacteraceae bacterium]